MLFVGGDCVKSVLQRIHERGSHCIAIFTKKHSFETPTIHQVISQNLAIYKGRDIGSCNAMAICTDLPTTSFKFQAERRTEVGRWKRPTLSPVQLDSIPTNSTLMMTFCGTQEEMDNSNTFNNSSTKCPLIAFKSTPTVEHYATGYGFDSINYTLTATPINLRALTLNIRIQSHQDNVISKLALTPEEITLLASISSDLYIQTNMGRIAKVIAGNPMKGLFALAPLTFKLKPDECEVRFAHYEPAAIPTSTGLMVTCKDFSHPPMDDSIEESTSAIVGLDGNDFLGISSEGEIFPGFLYNNLNVS